jgi:hypothetical protein
MRKVLFATLIAALALPLAAPAAPRHARQAPPKFFDKNFKLNVNLYDTNDNVFDATLNSVHPNTPWRVRDYLNDKLTDTSFEIDSSTANCFVVDDNGAANVPCSQIADLIDSNPDGVDAQILAKPYVDDDGDLGFVAKKIVVWL